MKILEAIRRANNLRVNTIEDEQKYSWANDLDGQIAEMMGKDAPLSVFPDDRDLLMPTPYEEIYQLYLVSKIDYYNNEIDMYTNDLMVYESALNEAKAWWRRNNKPPHRGNWNLWGNYFVQLARQPSDGGESSALGVGQLDSMRLS